VAQRAGSADAIALSAMTAKPNIANKKRLWRVLALLAVVFQSSVTKIWQASEPALEGSFGMTELMAGHGCASTGTGSPPKTWSPGNPTN
jgi:hypothetical protein